MSLTEVQEDKEKYLKLCENFKGVLSDKEFEYLKGEYEENLLIAEKIKKKIEELKAKREAS